MKLFICSSSLGNAELLETSDYDLLILSDHHLFPQHIAGQEGEIPKEVILGKKGIFMGEAGESSKKFP